MVEVPLAGLHASMRQYTSRRLLDKSTWCAIVGATLVTLALVGAGVSPASAAGGHGPKVDKRLADEVDNATAKRDGSTVRVISLRA